MVLVPDGLVVSEPFQRRQPGQSCGQERIGTMVDEFYGLMAEPDRRVWGAEQAFHAVRRAEQARQLARAAQRSAAHSLDNSADSHERTANAYDQAAEHRALREDEYREHAARHREFAEEDRRMAERLRRMADVGPTGFMSDPSEFNSPGL
jgi:hypothetical protein